MNRSYLLSLLLLLSLYFASVQSCGCRIPSVRSAYDNKNTKRVIWGTVQYTWYSGSSQLAIMQVNRQFKSCSFFEDDLVNLIVKTPRGGSCGVKFYQARSYFVPVQSFRQKSLVTACDGLRKFSELSSSEIRYIESKSRCPKDQGPVKLHIRR